MSLFACRYLKERHLVVVGPHRGLADQPMGPLPPLKPCILQNTFRSNINPWIKSVFSLNDLNKNHVTWIGWHTRNCHGITNEYSTVIPAIWA
jgi:hypothetical protein